MTRLLVGTLALAVLSWGCGGGATQDLLPMAPTDVAPATVTETFTGSVAQGNYEMHTFMLGVAPGAVSVTLTATGPSVTQIEGVGLGTPVGDICQLDLGTQSYKNDATASSTPQISGSLVTTGPWCVVVYDTGLQSGTITYTVSVSHS